MAGTPRTIRKVQTSKVADFDDQLWPINCAILILAGFVAGIVIAQSDFHNPHLIYNGWARLASVTVMVGLLFWGVMWLQGKMLRRLQLCLVISLLVHLWIAIYLHQQYLTLMAMEEAKSTQQVPEPFRRRLTMTAVAWPDVSQPRPLQSFEKPIDSEAPEPTEPEAVKREAEQPEIPPEAEPPDEPEVPQRQQPNPAVVRRAELSAPRRADVAAGGTITRQEWKHYPRPNEPAPEPEIPAQPRPLAAVPEPAIAPRQREEAVVRADQRQAVEEISSMRDRPSEMKLARRATGPEPIPDVPTTPTPSRRVIRPTDVPRTEAATPEPAKVAQRAPEIRPVPAERMIARREADAPTMVRQTSEPVAEPTAPKAIVEASARQRRAQQTPRLAQAPRAVPRRRAYAVTPPTGAAGPPVQAMAVGAPQQRATVGLPSIEFPRPAAGPASRRPVRVAQRTADLPVQPAPGAAAQGSPRRAEVAARGPIEPRVGRPVRPGQIGQPPQSAIAQAEQAAAPAQGTPSAQPSLPVLRQDATAVSSAADRSTPVAPSQPPGRALPPMTSVAQLPAAISARRTASSQKQPGGGAPAPASPTSLARFTPGINVPSTAVPVAAYPAATPAGAGGTPSSRVSQVDSSAAAVRRAGAQPPSGRGTAAAGTAEFALGSGQIVARAGQPRATGVGFPSTVANAMTPRPARASGPASAIASSGGPRVAPAAPGAAASGTRGPSTATFVVRDTPARRGGTVGQLAQRATVGAGPAGSMGTPGTVPVAQASRVTRYESGEGTIAGGGVPQPGRRTGGFLPRNVAAEGPQVAMAAPAGGGADQAPAFQVRASGPRREATGLPGGLQSQPRLGAVASLAGEGAAMAEAVARRATASGPGPGGLDLAAAQSVTMRKGAAGVEVPAAAVPIETAPAAGPGGVTVARGGLPSSLEKSPSATVRHAAADVSVGATTVASGTSDAGLGSAWAVAVAGQSRVIGEAVPAPDATAATPEIGRPAAVGPAIAAAGPAAAVPPSGAATGGPGPDAGSAPGVAGPVPGGAVAQGAGEGPAGLSADEAGPAAAPEGGAVAVARPTRVGRADAAMAAASAAPVVGPVRRVGSLDAAGTSTEAPEVAQAGPSTGGSDAAPDIAMQANLAGPQRQMAGLPGSLVDRTPVEGATQPGPASTTPATASGRRRLPPGAESGPRLAAEVGRGPLRRAEAPGLPPGIAEAVAEGPIAAAPSGPGEAIGVPGGAGFGEPGRREGGLPVQLVAMAGPGGLGYDPSPEVGFPSRRARPQSEIIHTVPRRFVIERSGGELAIDGRVREQPATAFRQRSPGRRAQVAQAWGGSVGTEKAVEMGLDFFARHQFPDGHWSLHELPEGVQHKDPGFGQMQADTAATGLALLTYLGAGYTHVDDKHRAVVNRGIDWLLRNQKPSGDLFTGGTKVAWFYSHAIGTIALCEAYGMTQDPDLREPVRKAIDFIVRTQHPERGGWRYSLDDKGLSTESDTSVSGWMLMALKSAQMAGLEVPQEALDKVDQWLDLAAAENADGQYIYNPYADRTKEEQLAGLKPNLAMTSEAMLMRMYLGYGREDPGLIAGAEHLMKNLPEVGTRKDSLRDCYYWYYATQAMFQMQQDYWTAWNDRLHPLLESSQVQYGEQAGSWHPMRPVRDKWGHAGGRLYVTALNVLMLEVYYRHLPLFQELTRE